MGKVSNNEKIWLFNKDGSPTGIESIDRPAPNGGTDHYVRDEAAPKGYRHIREHKDGTATERGKSLGTNWP